MRDPRLYIDDILEATRKIEKYVKGLTFEELKENSLVVDGVVRNLEIIGEAAKNIPAAVKQEYPDIEWKKISGLRDVLAHEYFGVDLEVVWNIVTEKIPALKKNIMRIRKKY